MVVGVQMFLRVAGGFAPNRVRTVRVRTHLSEYTYRVRSQVRLLSTIFLVSKVWLRWWSVGANSKKGRLPFVMKNRHFQLKRQIVQLIPAKTFRKKWKSSDVFLVLDYRKTSESFAELYSPHTSRRNWQLPLGLSHSTGHFVQMANVRGFIRCWVQVIVGSSYWDSLFRGRGGGGGLFYERTGKSARYNRCSLNWCSIPIRFTIITLAGLRKYRSLYKPGASL